METLVGQSHAHTVINDFVRASTKEKLYRFTAIAKHMIRRPNRTLVSTSDISRQFSYGRA